MSHLPERTHEVVGEVSQRLVAIGRYEPAAELYQSIDFHRGAINTYIQGGFWEKATYIAQVLSLLKARY